MKFNSILKQIKSDADHNVLPVDRIGPETAILLQQKIEAGELIVILGDRTGINSDKRINYVEFLGEPAPFSQGPFILASLLKCPVYLMFCLKEPKGYKVYFEKFSDQIEINRKTRNDDLQIIIQSFSHRLEHHCFKQPLQWFNFFDFWKLGDKG